MGERAGTILYRVPPHLGRDLREGQKKAPHFRRDQGKGRGRVRWQIKIWISGKLLYLFNVSYFHVVRIVLTP